MPCKSFTFSIYKSKLNHLISSCFRADIKAEVNQQNTSLSELRKYLFQRAYKMYQFTKYLILCTSLLFVPVVHAAPLFAVRQSITTLSTSQISPFKPYSYFASAGYCTPSTTLTWSCGGELFSIFYMTSG